MGKYVQINELCFIRNSEDTVCGIEIRDETPKEAGEPGLQERDGFYYKFPIAHLRGKTMGGYRLLRSRDFQGSHARPCAEKAKRRLKPAAATDKIKNKGGVV